MLEVSELLTTTNLWINTVLYINMTSLPILCLQVIASSADLATNHAIAQLNDKVKLIIENIAQLRHQLNDVVSKST
jgi:hypothetical protein